MSIVETQFVAPREAMERIIAGMAPSLRKSYHTKVKFRRLFSAFVGRTLIVYRMEDGRPLKIDELQVRSFELNSEAARVRIFSEANDYDMLFGHTPEPLFNCDAFVSVPTHMHVRRDVPVEGAATHHLVFPLLFHLPAGPNYLTNGAISIATPKEFVKLLGS
jgi:hypothetical protein